jgi:hypothetical protein
MAGKRKKSTAGRVCVSADTMRKLISLGAAHHATLAKLRSTARPVKGGKVVKKRAKKAKKRTSKRRK